jgi:hypothetical protein
MTEVAELNYNLFEVKNRRVLNDHANLDDFFDDTNQRRKIAADGWYLLDADPEFGWLLRGPFVDEESAREGAKDFAHWREMHKAGDEMPPDIQELD